MVWLPAPPESDAEVYAPFCPPPEALRAVSPLEALEADPDAARRTGITGFGDGKFWLALACHCASPPLFFLGGGVSWASFQIVMPFLIAFIVVSTLAWDFRLAGDPNEAHNLILHSLFLVSAVFLLNRLMTMEDFAPSPGWMEKIWNAGVDFAGAVPLLGGLVDLGTFLLKWLGYAVILFFVAGAVIFPKRVATSLLFVFGAIFIVVSAGQNLNPSLWSLGAGLLLEIVAFLLQRADEGSARFWRRAAEAFRGSSPLPALDIDLKLRLLRLLRRKRSVGEREIRALVAARLGAKVDDPRVSPVCVRLADQLSVRDGLAESRDGAGGWRFVLSAPEEADDFFAFTARVVRIALTLGFSVIYILSPVDFIPDATPVLGVADDMVLGAVALASALRTVFTSPGSAGD